MIRRRLWPVVMVLLVVPGPGAADGFCEVLGRIAAALETGQAPPEAALGAETCSVSTGIGGARSFHCFWSHPFRSEAARTGFDRLSGTVAACLGDDTVMLRDQPVNHPDTYDQIAYGAGGRTVRLSLKDKSALGRTLVHIAISANGP